MCVPEVCERLGPEEIDQLRRGFDEGLVRRYARPFSPERHEALTADQVFFARYLADDRLVPITARARP